MPITSKAGVAKLAAVPEPKTELLTLFTPFPEPPCIAFAAIPLYPNAARSLYTYIVCAFGIGTVTVDRYAPVLLFVYYPDIVKPSSCVDSPNTSVAA